MTTITMNDIERAVRNLKRSSTGRAAMRDLLALLDNSGLSLDEVNQQAVFNILLGAFTKFPGSARDAMRDALECDSLPTAH